MVAPSFTPKAIRSLEVDMRVKVRELLDKVSDKGEFNFSPVILRFSTAFGLSPRMRFDLTVNEFVKDIRKDKKLVVYDPDTWRPYCHVKDFSNAFITVLNSPKEKVA